MLDITETERLILTNQYKILCELSINKDDGSKEIYDELFEVFNNGYTSNYDDVTSNADYFVYDESILDNEGQVEVRNLLAMYQYLLNHIKSAKEVYKDLPDIRFVGYDLNDSYEAKKLSYMGFIFDTLKSYPDVNEAFGYSSERNSHGVTYVHENMLQKFITVKHNEDFYKDTSKYVKEILEAK